MLLLKTDMTHNLSDIFQKKIKIVTNKIIITFKEELWILRNL